MVKKNGFTIVELLVSLALLSIVMLSMFRLLSNVKYESNSDYFAAKNQEQRIEIIDHIEKEILKRKYSKNEINDKIIITKADNKLIISFNEKKWILKQVTDYKTNDCEYLDNNNKYYSCKIELYTNNTSNNKDNNNTIDDIIITGLEGE